jgi:hypothetical protein
VAAFVFGAATTYPARNCDVMALARSYGFSEAISAIHRALPARNGGGHGGCMRRHGGGKLCPCHHGVDDEKVREDRKVAARDRRARSNPSRYRSARGL